MKTKLIIGLLILSGCSAMTPEKVKAIDDFNALVSRNFASIAQVHNKLVSCIIEANNDFKKVLPCIKAAPTPVPAMQKPGSVPEGKK